MAIKSFKDLDAWQVGMDLVIRVYEVARRLPLDERFGMASQMHRAAVSIPSNVAEGHACKMLRRYRNHVRIALGSVAELSTNIEAGLRLGYWDTATAKQMDAEFTRMNQLLNGVLRSLGKQLLAEAAGCAVWILLLSEML
jgi:four helix bundle protein